MRARFGVGVDESAAAGADGPAALARRGLLRARRREYNGQERPGASARGPRSQSGGGQTRRIRRRPRARRRAARGRVGNSLRRHLIPPLAIVVLGVNPAPLRGRLARRGGVILRQNGNRERRHGPGEPRAISNCAATATAITAGSLPAIPAKPIGQTSLATRASAISRRAQLADEARALGRRADHADIGEAVLAQRLGDHRKVERMRMGDRQHQRAVGRRFQFGGRIGGGDQRDVGGRELGELVRPRIDPPHRERQRRQRQRQRAADMAGAEQIDRRRRLAERLAPLAVLGRVAEPALDAAVGAEARQRDERPFALGGAKRREVGEIARVEGLDPPDDAPAAALAELRPERDRAAARRPAPGGERRARFVERLVFEFAAADRAVKAAARRARPCARPPRAGLDPAVSASVISAAAPSASIASIRRRKVSMTRLGPQECGRGSIIVRAGAKSLPPFGGRWREAPDEGTHRQGTRTLVALINATPECASFRRLSVRRSLAGSAVGLTEAKPFRSPGRSPMGFAGRHRCDSGAIQRMFRLAGEATQPRYCAERRRPSNENPETCSF